MRFSDQCPALRPGLAWVNLPREGESAIEESMPQSIRELIGAAGRAEHGRSAAFPADSHRVAKKDGALAKATLEMRLIRMWRVLLFRVESCWVTLWRVSKEEK